MGNPPYDRDESQTDTSERRKGGMVRYDELRPAAWEYTAELLTLLDIIEHTLQVTPRAAALLKRIIDEALLTAAQLPTPTDAERKAPDVAREEIGQQPLFE